MTDTREGMEPATGEWQYERIPVGGGYTVWKGKHPAFGFHVIDEHEAKVAAGELNTLTAEKRALEQERDNALRNEGQWRENAMARLARAEAAESQLAAATARADAQRTVLDRIDVCCGNCSRIINAEWRRGDTSHDCSEGDDWPIDWTHIFMTPNRADFRGACDDLAALSLPTHEQQA